LVIPVSPFWLLEYYQCRRDGGHLLQKPLAPAAQSPAAGTSRLPLQLDLVSKSVLEVGAGVGDHTFDFLGRDCMVVSLEARRELPIVCRIHAGAQGFRLQQRFALEACSGRCGIADALIELYDVAPDRLLGDK
jgi:hypothetical protein